MGIPCEVPVPRKVSSNDAMTCSEYPHAGIVTGMSAMLRSLRIRNLALVEELAWELPAGFTAVTGETGAGKSIILGALKFLLGERADRGVVRSGASLAGIEAVFFLDSESQINDLLNESGIDPCQDGELILKRMIAAEGNARQFINGSPCNLSLLKEIGMQLVDLHGPHDHQSLFSRRAQTMLLDRYSDALPLRDNYLKCRADVSSAKRELDYLESEGGEDHLEVLLREVEEISMANLAEDEEIPLHERYKAASNARRLIELAALAIKHLDDDERGASVSMKECARVLRDLARLDSRAAALLETMERLSHDLNSFTSDLTDYAEGIEVDTGQLKMLEDRINLISTLRRKYGPSLSDVIARGEESSRSLERISGLKELRESAMKKLAENTAKLKEAGTLLGEKRRLGAARLAKKVATELTDMGFRRASFEIVLEAQTEPGPDGHEIADFLFSPNPGEEVHPLRSIASSGEISRLMLALKSALAEQDRIPLLVFDEIDANVGGEIATKVAGKMRDLGKNHQVLCITHLPQVASAANSQFMVVKTVLGGRTETTLEMVSSEDRINEIARMLGGVTESAKIHAKSLLGEGGTTSSQDEGN
jgi:DNA repair protein RecN (Recombination protein N)